VPIFWLDPLQFRENNLNSKSAKQQVAPKVAKMAAKRLLSLQLNVGMQHPNKWPKKYETVAKYIEAGRTQIKNYVHKFEKEKGTRPVGYLVWGVGMVVIHVERFN
jgi:hypothetical protein